MAFKSIGPAYVYVGNFTGTPDVYQLVDVEDVTVDLGLRDAYTSNADLNGTPTVEGIYRLSPRPVAQITLQDISVDQLQELVLGISKTTSGSDEGIGFGSTFEQIPEASVPSVFILPTSQSADGVGAGNGIWFPGATISGLDGISFGRVDEGEILNPFNLTINAVYRAADQAAASIPANARIAWMGPPAAFGLSWSLS
ncbi:MAG TPA: hypothetical protein VKN76_12075 [Kiloniellaceae bacterium]|nr:hypothetical protein [Kiloniellaceae bacterium]